MDTSKVLDQLFAHSTVTLPVAQKEVAIRKVTLRTLRPIVNLLSHIMEDLKLSANNLPAVDLNNPALILKLISNNYDPVVAIAAEHSSVNEEELRDMDMSDAVLVVQAVALLNKDFFMNKVLPNLRLANQGESSPKEPEKGNLSFTES